MKRFRITIYITILLSALLDLNCLAANVREGADLHDIKNYTSRDGLSQNTVRCILQDSTGFLWFGTTNGLNRYDGYSFKLVMPTDVEAYADKRINDLALTADGKIWIRSSSGSRYCYSPSLEKFISLEPSQLKEYTDSVTASEAALKRSMKSEVFGEQDPDHVNLLQDSKDFALFSDPADGYVWIYDKLSRKKHRVKVIDGRQSSSRYRMARSDDHTFWIITLHHGLVRYDSETGQTRRFTMRDGLPSNNLRCILADRDGNLWIGTNENGVIQIVLSKPSQVSQLLRESDSEGNTMEIRMAFTDREGRGWFGTHNANNNVYIVQGAETRKLSLPEGFAYCGIELSDGRKAIGTKNGGLYIVDPDGTTILGSPREDTRIKTSRDI